MRNNEKPTLAIDMDGVLADVETQFIHWYNREFKTSLTSQDIQGKSEIDAFPQINIIRKYANTPGFFRETPLMPEAIETIKNLQEYFEIYIVSAAMEFPQSLREKYDWLAEHFPFIPWKNIILCGDKSIIQTDFMIDDHCKNLDYCQGKPILFSAFHNVNIDRHERVNNWKEAEKLMHTLRISSPSPKNN